MNYEISCGVNTVKLNQIIGIDNVTLGLGHFVAALEKPRMTEYLLRKRNIESHEEYRPVDCVETDDVLADEVKVSGPELTELSGAVSVCIVADTCDIVGEGVEPNINYVLGVEVNGNSPLEGGS